MIEAFKRVKDFIVDFFSKKYTIYCYVVTINGWIEPPDENKRKVSYYADTTLQFEISFEDYPFFRAMVTEDNMKTFIRSLLKDLVESAEYVCTVNKAFTYYTQLPKGQVPIVEFIRNLTRYEILKVEDTYFVKVSTKPIFHVRSFSYKMVEKFTVSERILKEFEAIDTATIRIFRPGDIEPYFEFKFEYLHKLM